MRISDWSSDVCSSDLAIPNSAEHGPDQADSLFADFGGYFGRRFSGSPGFVHCYTRVDQSRGNDRDQHHLDDPEARIENSFGKLAEKAEWQGEEFSYSLAKGKTRPFGPGR